MATITFAGFRSRWMMPLSCAAASASASGSAIDSTFAAGIPPEGILVQRLPFHQLHRQEVHAIGFLDGMNGDDVRMVERGDGASLALEAFDAVRIAATSPAAP